jgi:hypothetical protein
MAGNDVRMPKFSVKTEFTADEGDKAQIAEALHKFDTDMLTELGRPAWKMETLVKMQRDEAVFGVTVTPDGELDKHLEVAAQMCLLITGSARVYVDQQIDAGTVTKTPAGILRALKFFSKDDTASRQTWVEVHQMTYEETKAAYPDKVKDFASFGLFKHFVYNTKLGGEITQLELKMSAVLKKAPSWMEQEVSALYSNPSQTLFDETMNALENREKLQAERGEIVVQKSAVVNAADGEFFSKADAEKMMNKAANQAAKKAWAEANNAAGVPWYQAVQPAQANYTQHQQNGWNNKPSNQVQKPQKKDGCLCCGMEFKLRKNDPSPHWAQNCPWKESAGGPGRKAAERAKQQGFCGYPREQDWTQAKGGGKSKGKGKGKKGGKKG